jgi:DNA-binding NarL/FixJ family response regulator
VFGGAAYIVRRLDHDRVGRETAVHGIEAGHNAYGGPFCDDQRVSPTVLIVDDHEDFRAAARSLLEADGFTVVGEAADGTEALTAIAELRPAVVLLDIQLPGIDGLAVAEQIATEPDPPAVVLVSSREARSYGPRLVQAPARGFIPKGELSGAALADLVT